MFLLHPYVFAELNTPHSTRHHAWLAIENLGVSWKKHRQREVWCCYPIEFKRLTSWDGLCTAFGTFFYCWLIRSLTACFPTSEDRQSPLTLKFAFARLRNLLAQLRMYTPNALKTPDIKGIDALNPAFSKSQNFSCNAASTIRRLTNAPLKPKLMSITSWPGLQ